MTLNYARVAVVVLFVGLSAAWSLGAAAQPAGIDPKADQLLKASMAYVAGLKQFGITSRSTLEVVLTSGQKIQFDHGFTSKVQRPNRFFAQRTGDLVDQRFYYDGKSLTLFSPGEGAYATVAAPPTIEGMLDFAREKLDIVAPAGDFIFSNAYDVLMDGVTDGFIVGKAVIEGARCDHLAFRAPHVDWQIWIQEGSQPLPRKIVITTRDQPNAPQFGVVITKWDLRPAISASTFSFTPPKGARKVNLLQPAAAATPAK